MKNILCILYLLLFTGVSPIMANWQRSITNYTRHIYHAGNQNWMLQQHSNGWMYVANNNGLLEFDGNDWHLYPLRNTKVRAMRIGNDGRIYVGGIGQFGYFTPTFLGELSYTCLSDSLPAHTTAGVIWNILTEGEKVYFQSDRSLFCWEAGKLHCMETEGGIYTAAVLYGKFYVSTERGIQVVEGGRQKMIPQSQQLGRITALLPYGGKILIVTHYHGLYLYDGETIRKHDCAAGAFAEQNRIFCATISRQLLALGSVQEGVCLLDLEKDEADVMSIADGLQNKTVLGMTFDAQGNLWLGLDNGIDCLHLSSPLSALYGNRPVIGSGYTSCLYRGKLYLGTNQGVYTTLPPSDGQGRETPMDFVAGTGGQVWNFLPHDGKLFCASDNGIFVLEEGRAEQLEGVKGVRNITAIDNRPDVLIAGTYGKYGGLYLLKKEEGKWRVGCRLKNFDCSPKCLAMEEGGRVLWITNKERGVCRLKLSEALDEVTEEKSYNHDGLTTGQNAFLAWISGEIVVASRQGLWHLNSRTDSLEEHRELEKLLNGKAPYTYLRMDRAHNIWYVSDGALKLLRYDPLEGTYSGNLRDVYLKGSLIEDCEHVEVNDGYAVAGTEEGFALIRLEPRPARQEPLSLQIRRVYLTEQRDSLVYGRSYSYEETPLVIPYHHNSLRIEYSVNNYDATHSSLFAYRLGKGSDKGEWSEFVGNRMKEFTGLREGKYLFSVKLLTEKGQDPVTASFAFEILPPWYRTWWSYLTYALACCLFAYYIYLRIVQSRRRLLMQKELELLRQQQEFQKESELKDRKIDSLKEENLQVQLRYKSEELARTTLNIIRKNEILMDIKKAVQGISHSITEENLVALRRKTYRLLADIETSIEHDDDLQNFQSTFDSVHQDFFKKLEEAFPELSSKDKLLCAYLKMNLVSKEIAPLMNISLRGVEISRYRLRKKLGLGEGENLAEFLQRFGK